MSTELHFYTAAEVADLLRMNHQVIQRKLQAGEIPGYRVGRDWRIERSQLLGWLEQNSNKRARTNDIREIEPFFTEEGRLTSLPAQRRKRELVLARLTEAFEADRTYGEREVNAVLRRFHHDVATIRRELIGSKMLIRTPDGIYKRAAPREPALRRG